MANKSVTKRGSKKWPDWLNPGNWVYEPDRRRYWLVLSVNKKNRAAYLFGREQAIEVDKLVQARVEGWSLEQAPFGVKVLHILYLLEGERYCAVFHLTCTSGSSLVYKDGENAANPDELALRWVQLDGSPAGVPKHINTVIDQWVLKNTL